jgi:hypothetical protein
MSSTSEIRRQSASRRSPPKSRHFQPHRRMRGRRSGHRCPLPQGQAPRLRSNVRLAPAKRKRVTYQTDIGLGETLGGQGGAPEKLAKGETSRVLRWRPPAGRGACFGSRAGWVIGDARATDGFASCSRRGAAIAFARATFLIGRSPAAEPDQEIRRFQTLNSKQKGVWNACSISCPSDRASRR